MLLCLHIAWKYYLYAYNEFPVGTLIGNVLNLGISPLEVAFLGGKYPVRPHNLAEDGVSDSIRLVLTNHIRPGSESHAMLIGLTKSF